MNKMPMQSALTSAPTIFERFSRGDNDAFNEFIDRYGRWVACVVRRHLGWRTDDFDDAMQDAMLALWRAAPRFDRTRGAETTYIALIVRQAVSEHRRKAAIRSRGVRAALDLEEVEARTIVGHPEQPQRLHRALSRLLPEERDLVELAIVGGKTHAEVAQATGLSTERVKRTVSRVLARLRRELAVHKAAA